MIQKTIPEIISKTPNPNNIYILVLSYYSSFILHIYRSLLSHKDSGKSRTRLFISFLIHDIMLQGFKADFGIVVAFDPQTMELMEYELRRNNA